MPSLDKLKLLNEFNDVDIIPINIGGDTYEKAKEFFEDYNINNLEIFFGSGREFSEKFKIRGLPTTILIDKNGGFRLCNMKTGHAKNVIIKNMK